MKDALIDAYKTFESSFDGSKMLSIAQDFKTHLKSLKEKATNMDVTLPRIHPKRNREDIDRIGVQGTDDVVEESARMTVEGFGEQSS